MLSQINLAVDRLPDFLCCPSDASGAPGPQHRGTVHFESMMHEIEDAYRQAAQGVPATRPVIEMTIPSALDATISPPGNLAARSSCVACRFMYQQDRVAAGAVLYRSIQPDASSLVRTRSRSCFGWSLRVHFVVPSAGIRSTLTSRPIPLPQPCQCSCLATRAVGRRKLDPYVVTSIMISCAKDCMPMVCPPAGKHVVQLFVQFAPYDVDPTVGHWADPDFKQRFVDRCLNIVEEFAPGFK